MKQQFNEFVQHNGGSGGHRPVNPEILGVVFTMVQIYSQRVTAAQQVYLNEVELNSRVSVLESKIRNNPRHFGSAGENGVPAMLRATDKDDVVREFNGLADEVLGALALSAGGVR